MARLDFVRGPLVVVCGELRGYREITLLIGRRFLVEWCIAKVSVDLGAQWRHVSEAVNKAIVLRLVEVIPALFLVFRQNMFDVVLRALELELLPGQVTLYLEKNVTHDVVVATAGRAQFLAGKRCLKFPVTWIDRTQRDYRILRRCGLGCSVCQCASHAFCAV